MNMQGRNGPSGQKPVRGPMRGHGPMGRGGPMAFMKGDRARDFWGSMRKLIEYLGDYRFSIVIVILFAVASTAFTIIGPKILGSATTILFEGVMGHIGGTGAGIDFEYIGRALLTALAAGFGRVVTEVGAAIMLGGNIRGSTRTMTTAIVLETSKGEFGQALALGLILLLVAFGVNLLLHVLRAREAKT